MPPRADEFSSWEHDHPGEIFIPPGNETHRRISEANEIDYHSRGRRSLPHAEDKERDNEDDDEAPDFDEKQYYAHKDRKELYDIIHTAFLK